MHVSLSSYNHTSSSVSMVQTQYIASQSLNRKITYSGNEITPQVKDIAYVFGEQVVKPILEWVPKITRSFFSIPGAEAKMLPPNIVEAIREYIGGIGSLRVTNDMVEKILNDKLGDERVNLDPEIVRKIKAAFAKACDIAGVVVDASEFSSLVVDELENAALTKIAEISRKKEEHDSQGLNIPRPPPKNEKEILRDKYFSQLRAYLSIYELQAKINDQTLERMQQMGPELKQLDKQLEEMYQLAHEILEKAKQHGDTYLNIDDLRKTMMAKITVGKELKASLTQGLANANYILGRYREAFGDLTPDTISMMSLEDQDIVIYWQRRLYNQQVMLKYVNAQLPIDQAVLNSYNAGASNIASVVTTLKQQLEDVDAKYNKYTEMKTDLMTEIPVVVEQNKNAIKEGYAASAKYQEAKKNLQDLFRDEL